MTPYGTMNLFSNERAMPSRVATESSWPLGLTVKLVTITRQHGRLTFCRKTHVNPGNVFVTAASGSDHHLRSNYVVGIPVEQ